MAALKQAESGVPVAEVIGKVRISEQIFYRWKKQYVGMETDQARQMDDAKRLIGVWRQEYNQSRAHRSLGEKTPGKFASQYATSCVLTATLNQPKTNSRLRTRKLLRSKPSINCTTLTLSLIQNTGQAKVEFW